MFAVFHFGLEQVGRGVAGAMPGDDFDVVEHLPVLPVVRLDDLEGPESVDDVAANQRLIDVVREVLTRTGFRPFEVASLVPRMNSLNITVFDNPSVIDAKVTFGPRLVESNSNAGPSK